MFTGGDHYQNVMTWDVRARALVYELATGNTAVRTLTWDERHATLYAGTENEYMDRHGNTYDYRGARIAPWAYQTPLEPRVRGKGGEDDEMDDEDEEGEEEDSDDDWDEHEQCWPKRATHDEKAFGYAYDAGEHVFREYLLCAFSVVGASTDFGDGVQCGTSSRRTQTRRCCPSMARLRWNGMSI